jgi:hypothetical protein
VFGDRTSGAHMHKFAWTNIVRHQTVKQGASPDDPTLAEYWARRQHKTPLPINHTAQWLHRVQDGRCAICKSTLTAVEDAYRIISANGATGPNPVCLEAEGSNPQDGAVVDEYGCDPNSINQPNQLWIIDQADFPNFLNGPSSFGSFPAADVYNVATIQEDSYGAAGDGFAYSNSPAITVTSTRVPGLGSNMTLMSGSDVNNSPYPVTNESWYLNQIVPSSGSSNGSGPTCTMFQCLVGG